MQQNSSDYKFFIELALDNAKKRINLLDNSNKKCVLEEYKEWIKDGLNKHTVLLIRDDPIIWNKIKNFLIPCVRSHLK